MKCSVHKNVDAQSRCEGCAEPFCSKCIVEIHGQQFCGDCKVIKIKDRSKPPRKIDTKKIPETAWITFAAAVFGLFCCCLGIIAHPIALVLSYQATQELKADPDLGGWELVRAGQIIAVIGLSFMIFSIAAKLLAPES